MRLIRRFPALLWIPMYIGSLFILFASSSRERTLSLAIGLTLAGVATVWALWLTLARWRGHPRPRWLLAFVIATIGFYVVAAVIVWATSGARFGVAAALAGLYPLAAVALWVASARPGTVERDGELRDASASDHTDPFPSIGASDHRPMGDVDQVHDEISPHDLPPGHPGRAEAARIARDHGGTTRGHRQGGAAAAGGRFVRADGEGELVGEDEQDGARAR